MVNTYFDKHIYYITPAAAHHDSNTNSHSEIYPSPPLPVPPTVSVHVRPPQFGRTAVHLSDIGRRRGAGAGRARRVGALGAAGRAAAAAAAGQQPLGGHGAQQRAQRRPAGLRGRPWHRVERRAGTGRWVPGRRGQRRSGQQRRPAGQTGQRRAGHAPCNQSAADVTQVPDRSTRWH